MDTVHVLLPVHNRKRLTLRFLDSLKAQSYPRIHLVVIDDGSTDGTKDAVLAAYPRSEVIRADGTLWWAGCLQRGIERLHEAGVADADIVLFINDDTTFETNFVANAVDFLNQKSGCILLARIKNSQTGAIEESGVSADLRTLRFEVARSPDAINCLSTRGLFMRWGDLRMIGGFFPRLLPHYLSDYEYTLRARRKGLRVATVENVWLNADLNFTGLRDLNSRAGWEFVRALFSVKCAINPIYMTSFVFLAVPPKWIFPNLLRVWWRALKQIVGKGLMRVGSA